MTVVKILTQKNRIHGVCQNVEFYLNYTKFYNFLLKTHVKIAPMGEEKLALKADIHTVPQPKLSGWCG